jgi:dinuclear metal center YbgI/SA1388 family protein
MEKLNAIIDHLDIYLDTKNIKDDSWNGLQVEGRENVSKIMFAVDAGQETFDKAVELHADMIVVHHGIFWKPASPVVTGWKKKQIETLLNNGISLYASHLPLDKHPEVGNNAQLIKLLGYEKDKGFCQYHGETISFTGKTNTPKTINEVEEILTKELGASCKVLPFGKKEISTIAVCSGGGAAHPILNEAIEVGADLYLTGDATEMYHLIKDQKMNVIFAGHHATETVGVKALAEYLKNKFDVETEFVNIPTGL